MASHEQSLSPNNHELEQRMEDLGSKIEAVNGALINLGDSGKVDLVTDRASAIVAELADPSSTVETDVNLTEEELLARTMAANYFEAVALDAEVDESATALAVKFALPFNAAEGKQAPEVLQRQSGDTDEEHTQKIISHAKAQNLLLESSLSDSSKTTLPDLNASTSLTLDKDATNYQVAIEGNNVGDIAETASAGFSMGVAPEAEAYVVSVAKSEIQQTSGAQIEKNLPPSSTDQTGAPDNPAKNSEGLSPAKVAPKERLKAFKDRLRDIYRGGPIGRLATMRGHGIVHEFKNSKHSEKVVVIAGIGAAAVAAHMFGLTDLLKDSTPNGNSIDADTIIAGLPDVNSLDDANISNTPVNIEGSSGGPSVETFKMVKLKVNEGGGITDAIKDFAQVKGVDLTPEQLHDIYEELKKDDAIDKYNTYRMMDGSIGIADPSHSIRINQALLNEQIERLGRDK